MNKFIESMPAANEVVEDIRYLMNSKDEAHLLQRYVDVTEADIASGHYNQAEAVIIRSVYPEIKDLVCLHADYNEHFNKCNDCGVADLWPEDEE